MWTGMGNGARSDVKNELVRLGFTDVVLSGGRLPTIGGPSSPAAYEADVVLEYRNAGIRVHRGFRANSYGPTMLVPPFDGFAWDKLNDATAALMLRLSNAGYSGIAWDNETWTDERTPTWNWDAPGHPDKPETHFRYAMTLRGSDFQRRLNEAWPNMEVMSYFNQIPGNYTEWAASKVSGLPFPVGYPRSTLRDWQRGMMSRGGFSRWTILNYSFYKGAGYGKAAPPAPYPAGPTGAAQFDRDETAKIVKGWGADPAKVKAAPFVAISPISDGIGDYRDALNVNEATGLIDAAAATSDTVGIYHYGAWPYAGFSYDPYAKLLKSVASR
jgi:hypothetical protein